MKTTALAVMALLWAWPAVGATPRTLDACDMGKIDTTMWKRVSIGSSWSILAPPSFKEDKTYRPTHGGTNWKGDNITFYIAGVSLGGKGYAPTRKKGPAQSECVATVDGSEIGLTTAVEDRRYTVGARFAEKEFDGGIPAGGPIMSTVFGGEGHSSNDQRILLTIIRSLKRERK